MFVCFKAFVLEIHFCENQENFDSSLLEDDFLDFSDITIETILDQAINRSLTQDIGSNGHISFYVKRMIYRQSRLIFIETMTRLLKLGKNSDLTPHCFEAITQSIVFSTK